MPEPVLRRIRLLPVPVLYHIHRMRERALYRTRLLPVLALHRIHRMLVRHPSHSRLRRPGPARLSQSFHAAGCKSAGSPGLLQESLL
jgi:hypothetical protein